jgi:flagellar protein FlgJ
MLNADLRMQPMTGMADVSAASGLSGASAFTGLYRQLHDEVTRYIENGSEGSGGAVQSAGAVGLSPEGALRQMQVEGQLGSVGGADAQTQQSFMSQVGPMAEDAAQALGVSPDILVAQAALETGWGQQPIKRADGSNSHNLFALKAGAAWRGDVTQITTTEYEQGQATTQKAAFRSYDGPAAAFRDFAQLIKTSPRYQGALQAGSDVLAYGRALQGGGYATDPAYADKLAKVTALVTRMKGAMGPASNGDTHEH